VEFGVGELAVFDAQVAELSRSIVEALGSEANLGRQCATVLPGVRRDLAADAEALREHHAVVAATAQRVAGLAQSVQVKVGRALGGLQIGDTTRQRIEHVQTAIEMVERYENDPASPTDLDRARLARAVRRMLAAQMADAVSHFRRDAGQVSESLAGMAEDADQILRLKDLTYGGSAANGESFLRSLERSVDGAKSLVATVHAASREADEIARSTASTANILTGRIAGVKQVRFDIHLMALNTALRCRHMGEAGRPLAAIATELRGYADKLDSLAYGAASALGQLATDAASNQGEPTAEVDPNTVLDGAINQIRVAGNGAESSLRRLALQSGDVAELLARTERQLDFSRDLTEAMEAAAETLTRLAGTDDEPLSEAQAADLAPLFDEIGALYTMAREREIHAQGAPSNGQAAPQAPVVVASSGGDDLDDFLF
jgi:methyl-accepting chemotaxis protein